MQDSFPRDTMTPSFCAMSLTGGLGCFMVFCLPPLLVSNAMLAMVLVISPPASILTNTNLHPLY